MTTEATSTALQPGEHCQRHDARAPSTRCAHNHDLTNPENVETGRDGTRIRTRCKPCRIERQRRHRNKTPENLGVQT